MKSFFQIVAMCRGKKLQSNKTYKQKNAWVAWVVCEKTERERQREIVRDINPRTCFYNDSSLLVLAQDVDKVIVKLFSSQHAAVIVKIFAVKFPKNQSFSLCFNRHPILRITMSFDFVRNSNQP